MHFKPGALFAVLLASILLTGCGSGRFRLPFAMGPELTPEEMRQKHGEGAKYLLNEPTTPGTPTASASAAGAAQPAPSRKFEVAPDLVNQPPVRQAARTALAAAVPASAPSASRYGDLLFISGQLPLDARGNPPPANTRIEDQARLAMENVRAVLEANRLTMANVVSMTVYLQDLNDVTGFDAVYSGYFKGTAPSRTVVEVSRLPRNARVEISAVAGK